MKTKIDAERADHKFMQELKANHSQDYFDSYVFIKHNAPCQYQQEEMIKHLDSFES